MDPFTISALVAGGVGAVSALGQHRANKSNEHSAHEQMRFQERMSSTAYSRAMKDMKEAGLNPILAYSQGGAQVPSGAAYQAQDALGKGANTALETRRLHKELEALSSQKAVNASLIAYQQAQANQANTAANLNTQNAELAKAKTAIANIDTKIAGNQFHSSQMRPRVVLGKFADKIANSQIVNSARSQFVKDMKGLRNPIPEIKKDFYKFKNFVKNSSGVLGRRRQAGK